jgi:hypothetical protein
MTEITKRIWATDTRDNDVAINLYHQQPTGNAVEYVRLDITDKLAEALDVALLHIARLNMPSDDLDENDLAQLASWETWSIDKIKEALSSYTKSKGESHE